MTRHDEQADRVWREEYLRGRCPTTGQSSRSCGCADCAAIRDDAARDRLENRPTMTPYPNRPEETLDND